MKIFVTGAGGQLGRDVVIALEEHGHVAVESDVLPASDGVRNYVRLDITDREAVRDAVMAAKPDAIIHCAAWTDVDGAEAVDKRNAVREINASGSRHIAEAARAVDAKMIYISTDYVFDGYGERPWKPEDERFAPLNVYGQTKREGELAVSVTLEKYFIVRTSWMFGLTGKNFIKTMVEAGKTHDTVYVVDDQIGTPTYTLDLARLLANMIETEKFGYYHATNEGSFISWYDFCCEIYRQYGLNAKVIPVSTSEYGFSKAKRPLNSRMDKSKLATAGFERLPDWRDALRRYLKEAKL